MSKLHTPKVKFVLPSNAKEAGLLTYYLTPGSASSNWRKAVFMRHPDLEKFVENCSDKDEVYKQCFKYVEEYRRGRKGKLKKSLQENEKIWRTIEKKYLQTLEEHFEIEYPKHRKIMKAYVSIVPIYPRDLSNWSFNVSYYSPKRVKEIACHEILHFLYFKKWLEVFPETKFKELNHPHLVWRLSELIDPVILGEHPEFRKFFNRKQKTYPHFQKIRIKNRQPTTHLAVIYRRHLKSGAPFSDFLREIWKFAQDNKKALMDA